MPKPQPEDGRVSLYTQVLGPQAARLAPVLSRLHDGGERRISGTLNVHVAAARLTRFLLRLAGMPLPAHNAACELHIVPGEDGETWHRCFDGRSLVSRQHARDDKGISERIGWLTIHLQLQVRKHRLLIRSSLTRFCGVRLPAALGVQVVAQERAMNSHTFHCDVRVRSPLLGPLLSYSGTLRLENPSEQFSSEALKLTKKGPPKRAKGTRRSFSGCRRRVPRSSNKPYR